MVFKIMIWPFVSCEIRKTYFTESNSFIQPIKEEGNFNWFTLSHFGPFWSNLGNFGQLRLFGSLWSTLVGFLSLWSLAVWATNVIIDVFSSFRFVDTMQLRRLARMHHEVFPQWGGRHPGDIFLHQAFHLFWIWHSWTIFVNHSVDLFLSDIHETIREAVKKTVF